jgi:hypothetical protein
MQLFKLSALVRHPMLVFTSAMGVLCSTMFMSITGGGLKPYEFRALQGALAVMAGDQRRAAALFAEIQQPRAWTQTVYHPPPAAPLAVPIEVPADSERDLLGGPLPEAPRILAARQSLRAPIDRCDGVCEAREPAAPLEIVALSAAEPPS